MIVGLVMGTMGSMYFYKEAFSERPEKTVDVARYIKS
jgi:hypothetical protein